MRLTIPNTLSRLLVVTLLLGGGMSASAALVNANAQIDWSSFKVTTTGTAAITFTSQSDRSSVNFGVPVSAPNWTTGTLVSQSSPTASASTSATRLSASATEPSIAQVDRSGDFSISGNGFVLFQVNYSLDATLAAGRPEVFMAFLLSASPSSGTTNIDFSQQGRELPSGSTSQTGTLGVALLVQDGMTGNISARATALAPSPTPIPASVLLLGSSLLGLIGLGRKQQGAA
jgi:hypothetical protein